MQILRTEVFARWLRRLKDRQAKAIIGDHLDRMLRGDLGDVKPVGDGVWEKRIHFGQGWRIYYTIVADQVIVLLLGGDKATQKRDIMKAIKIKKGLK